MSIKTTLVLLLLLVTVGLAALFWPQGERGGPSVAGEQPVLTPAMCDPARLASISIRRESDEVTLAPARDAWRQSLPVEFALHPQAIDELATQLARLRSFQRLAPDDPQAPATSDLRLDPPLARVELKPTQGEAHVLLLGRTAPGNRAYLRVEGDPTLHVVNHDLHRLILEQSPSDRLDRALRPPPAERLEALSVERGGASVRLRREAGAWRFEPPLVGRAAQAGVEAITRGVSGLSVLGFVEHERDPRSLGLDKPELIVLFTTPSVGAAGGESWELKLGGAADLTGRRRYASWSRAGLSTPAAVVEVDAAQVAALPTGVESLRDRRVTPARLENVRELAVSGPGRRPLRLIKTTEGWVFAGKDQGEAQEPPFPADAIEAAAMVAQAVHATATGFIASPVAQGPPVVEVALRGLAGLEDGWALHRAGDVKPALPEALAREPALARGAIVAIRAGDSVGYVLPEEQLARVTAPALSLRDRVIWDASASPLRTLALRVPGGSALTFERRLAPLPGAAGKAGEAEASASAWGLVGHDRFEREDFSRLLRLLEPLRAEAWVEGPAPAAALELALIPEQGEGLSIAIDPVSRIATRVTSGVGVGGGVGQASTEAFRLTPELARALTLEYRHRSLWPAGSEVARVTVTRGPDVLAVERGADGRFTSPHAASLHEAAATRLFNTLAGLRVVRYLPDREAPASPPTARLDAQTVAGARGSLTLWEVQTAAGEYLGRFEAQAPGKARVVWLTVTAAALEGLTGPLVQRR